MLRPLRSFASLAFNDLRGTITRPKTVVTLILVGLAFMLSAWAIAHSTIAPVEEEDTPGYPGLWKEGAEGAFATQALGVAPLLLPLLPIAIAYDAIERDQISGFLEMAASRPVPRRRIALAKFVGAFTAIAVPVAALALACTLLVQNIVGETIDNTFILAFLASSLLLTALYLSLVFMLAAILTPGTALGLSVLLWISSIVISRSAFTIAGQFLLIVPLTGAPTFQTTLIDLASFTGVYQGLLAIFVPSGLNLVIWPTLIEWGAQVVSWAVALAGIPWWVTLLVLYVYFFGRLQVR